MNHFTYKVVVTSSNGIRNSVPKFDTVDGESVIPMSGTSKKISGQKKLKFPGNLIGVVKITGDPGKDYEIKITNEDKSKTVYNKSGTIGSNRLVKRIVNVPAFTVFLCLLFSFNESLGQNSVLQDSDGESSIVANDNNAVTFNFKDSKIKFSRSWQYSGNSNNSSTDYFHYCGFEGSLKTTEGTSPILSKGRLNPAGEFGLYYSWSWDAEKVAKSKSYKDKVVSSDLFIIPGVQAEQFNLVDTSNVVKNDYDIGYKVSIGFNRITPIASNKEKEEEVDVDTTLQFKKCCADNFFSRKDTTIAIKKKFKQYHQQIWGVLVTFSSANNLNDLTKEKYYNSQVSGNNLFLSDEKVVFRSMENFERSFLKINFNVDYVFMPYSIKPVGFVVYNRYTYKDVGKNKNNTGIGIVMGKNESPQEIVGGVQVEVDDIFDLQNKGTDFGERVIINLVVGYPF